MKCVCNYKEINEATTDAIELNKESLDEKIGTNFTANHEIPGQIEIEKSTISNKNRDFTKFMNVEEDVNLVIYKDPKRDLRNKDIYSLVMPHCQ